MSDPASSDAELSAPAAAEPAPASEKARLRRKREAIVIPGARVSVANERFIPVSRDAVCDRLLEAHRWEGHDLRALCTTLRYSAMLRQQQSAIALDEAVNAYRPFNPDNESIDGTDLGAEQRSAVQEAFFTQLQALIERANYERISPEDLEAILGIVSPYGVAVDVDLSEFETMLLYFRGAGVEERYQRDWKSLYLFKTCYQVPIYRRLFMAVKLKPEALRVAEIMAAEHIDEAKARRRLKRRRGFLPPWVSSDHCYLKLFKNIPQIDLEMLFPNTRVKLRYWDKIKLGVTAGGSTLVGLVTTATKVLVAATNPVALVMAFGGLAGIIFRQVMNLFNTRNRYMMQLAQSLYFQNLANNQGVLALLIDDGEEEDMKEDTLLYTHLLGHAVTAERLPEVKDAIERFLFQEFGASIGFDICDSLDRLTRGGLVRQGEHGLLQAVPPREACVLLRQRWMDRLDDGEDADMALARSA